MNSPQRSSYRRVLPTRRRLRNESRRIRIDSHDTLAADDTFRFPSSAKKLVESSCSMTWSNSRSGILQIGTGIDPDAGFAVEAVCFGPGIECRFSISTPLSCFRTLPRQSKDYLKRGGGVLVAAGSNVAARGNVFGTKDQ